MTRPHEIVDIGVRRPRRTSITICRTDDSTALRELVPLLRDDRERGDFLVQAAREIVDLRLRRVAACEYAEVHPHFECG